MRMKLEPVPKMLSLTAEMKSAKPSPLKSPTGMTTGRYAASCERIVRSASLLLASMVPPTAGVVAEAWLKTSL